jgi:CheY-like chemotaxis protein
VALDRPGVAVLDVQIPRMSGIEATRRIRVESPDVRLLILTAYDDDPYIFAPLQAGASGQLLQLVGELCISYSGDAGCWLYEDCQSQEARGTVKMKVRLPPDNLHWIIGSQRDSASVPGVRPWASSLPDSASSQVLTTGLAPPFCASFLAQSAGKNARLESRRIALPER